MNAYQFFMKHAGYSYDPKTETPMQGRIKCARSLAKAERAARDGGFSYQWHEDGVSDSTEFAKGKRYALWICLMRDASGAVVGSLCGIDFGRDKEPWGDPYRRVVEAELALENIDNERNI